MWSQALLAIGTGAITLSGALAEWVEPDPSSWKQCELLDSASWIIYDTNNITVANLESINHNLQEKLNETLSSPYFSVFKVDLTGKQCPVPGIEEICVNRACAVETLEDDPELEFSAPYLGMLRADSVSPTAPKGSLEDCAPDAGSIFANRAVVDQHDYCYPEDESVENSDGVWVNLSNNVERYTGYSGPSANSLWKAVYRENCFAYVGHEPFSTPGEGSRDAADGLGRANGQAESELHNLFAGGQQALGSETPPEVERAVLQSEAHCVEQRLFYKLLSGMHASISTHLSYDYFFADRREWGHNLPAYMIRVGEHPDRLNNLYFNYVLVTRAVAKLGKFLPLLSFSESCPSVDSTVRDGLAAIANSISSAPRAINETSIFASEDDLQLKEVFRTRVRNVNALMSCVGCERCRLWGKIQTAGYGTALKILFELPLEPADDPDRTSDVLASFRRSELVALMQTLGRISHSVEAAEEFRHMVYNVTGVEPRDQSAVKTEINTRAFKYQLNKGLSEVGDALVFVCKSYIQFPQNCFRVALYYLSLAWDRLIGRETVRVPVVVEKEREL